MHTLLSMSHLKLSGLLAALGFLIALSFTIVSGSGTTALIVRPLLSALVMFVIGSGLYLLLANKVPEAIEVLEPTPETMDAYGGESPDGESVVGEGDSGEGGDYTGADGSSANLDAYDSQVGSSAASNIPRKTGVTIGKEEIVVNGVKFKNQPEVMAETIKQLIDQDKE